MGKKRKKKKVLLSGSDPFYLSKKLRRRRYGEVSAQTSQKSQNRALVKKKVAYRAPAAQACTPPTWTINRIFSKSEILAESLEKISKTKKNFFLGKFRPLSWVFGHKKVQKSAKIGCFDDLGVNQMHYYRGRIFLSNSFTKYKAIFDQTIFPNLPVYTRQQPIQVVY